MSPATQKPTRKKVRALARLAYERELANALAALEAEFTHWRAGRLDAFDLSDRVHAFHDGTARDLYKLYVLGEPELVVARALERGLVSEAEADAEVLEAVTKLRDLLRQRSESPDDPK